jgi:hypothetical protein
MIIRVTKPIQVFVKSEMYRAVSEVLNTFCPEGLKMALQINRRNPGGQCKRGCQKDVGLCDSVCKSFR